MIATATLLDWMKADAADTAMLRILEQAAVKAAEKITGLYLGIANASYTDVVRFKGWPLQLTAEPTGGVITSLEQWDGSAYAVVPAADYYADGSLIWSNYTYTLPTTTTEITRVRAIYPAGYAGTGDVWAAPADIQQGVLLLVGHWYENRESVIVGSATEVPQGVHMLLSAYRRVTV